LKARNSQNSTRAKKPTLGKRLGDTLNSLEEIGRDPGHENTVAVSTGADDTNTR
jgi:hypothetical protein